MMEEIKRPRERSKEYPTSNLRVCIDFVEEVNSKLGNRVSNATQIAKALGKAEKTIQSYLSSSKQYGLLDLQFKVGYKPTDLFYKVTRGRTEEIKRASLIEAFLRPAIYNDYLTKHNGESLPDDMPSIFYWDYKITEGSKDYAAKVFLANVDFLKLAPDGILSVSTIPAPESEERPETKNPPPPIVNPPPAIEQPPIQINPLNKRLEIRIAPERFVTIDFPADITNDEVDKLSAKIKAALGD